MQNSVMLNYQILGYLAASHLARSLPFGQLHSVMTLKCICVLQPNQLIIDVTSRALPQIRLANKTIN